MLHTKLFVSVCVNCRLQWQKCIPTISTATTKEAIMFFTLEVYKADRRTKAGTVLVSKTDYDLPTKEEMV